MEASGQLLAHIMQLQQPGYKHISDSVEYITNN
jgi:hypothetical protein